jgi:hypothetical protein
MVGCHVREVKMERMAATLEANAWMKRRNREESCRWGGVSEAAGGLAVWCGASTVGGTEVSRTGAGMEVGVRASSHPGTITREGCGEFLLSDLQVLALRGIEHSVFLILSAGLLTQTH